MQGFVPFGREQQRQQLQELKCRLLIPDVWERLGLPGKASNSCRSPFREDKSPSFSITADGRRWKDYGTGAGGDVIDFIAAALDVDSAEAVRRFLHMAGAWTPPAATALRPKDSHVRLELPPLRMPSAEEIATIAESRHLEVSGVYLAVTLGLLRTGEVHGHPSWILLDSSGKVAEARRLDGKPFPAVGRLCQRKAHTLRGSSKSWPVGSDLLRKNPNYRAIMLVEGGPDLLAGLQYAMDGSGVLPVALLGRSSGSKIDSEALSLMKGKRVRIYPHNDPDGGGMMSAQGWADQLYAVGCVVDFFTFTGLTRRDGVPVKDLNDLTVISEFDGGNLASLLP